MRYPAHILDEIRARLPVSQVVARKVALKRAGREFRGLSPFKVEKSPSFFVNDQKGFYHCFATGEHGDIFTFVMKTEGLSFPEAVERLAGEAGVVLPKPDQRDERREDERTRLLSLVEASATFFEAALKSGEAGEARAYLEKRGLDRATIGEFRIGYAPGKRSALKEHLAAKGYAVSEMIASGMLIGGEDIATPYDRFRHRIMFPITDPKNRPIAFGGRALDPTAPAKYLNSPETTLFHKGAVLFNAARARPASHTSGRVIVVEGYMDVVALAQAGFADCVAPLGTALTADQLALLWRMSSQPVLCFDGDGAGVRAAYRAVETALPLLQSGKSVAFAFLPDGLDPDDLVRQQGADAFARLLEERKKVLFDVLIEREERAVGSTMTPDARANLETRLRALVGKIGDAAVRGQYEQELKATLWSRSQREVKALLGHGGRRGQVGALQRRNNVQPDWRIRERARLGQSMRQGDVFVRGAMASNELTSRTDMLPQREALLLRALLYHPWLISDHAEEIAAMELSSEPLSRLRDALLALPADNISLDRAMICSQLERTGVQKVVELVDRAITHSSDRFAQSDAERTEVITGWRHTLALHERQSGLKRALEAAEQEWYADNSEESFQRILEIQRLMSNLTNLEFPAD